MKKHIAMLCAVLLTALAAFAPGAAAAGPALTATEAYCIIDADTGLVLAQQNMNEELHPASITKVMTLGLACEKAQGKWDNVKLTVSHEDVYSLAGTDSSHIALQEGEEVPLTDALYATMMASANDGANLLAEYFGGGSIEGGVAAMNAQAKELGLEHTHFANPHGISDEDHYTSCYDMAQILRWALTQPGFETLFTRNEMYTMGPTNVQPVTRYFHQQDKMRVSSSRYYIPAILGSKIGYTNIARYSYVCLAEQNGVRLICVTMQSQIKTDKYNDVRTLLDDAFARYTGYTEIPAQDVTGELEVAGGGSTLLVHGEPADNGGHERHEGAEELDVGVRAQRRVPSGNGEVLAAGKTGCQAADEVHRRERGARQAQGLGEQGPRESHARRRVGESCHGHHLSSERANQAAPAAVSAANASAQTARPASVSMPSAVSAPPSAMSAASGSPLGSTGMKLVGMTMLADGGKSCGSGTSDQAKPPTSCAASGQKMPASMPSRAVRKSPAGIIHAAVTVLTSAQRSIVSAPATVRPCEENADPAR